VDNGKKKGQMVRKRDSLVRKRDNCRSETQIDPPIGGLKRTPMSLRILVLEMCKQLVALPPDPQGIFDTLGLKKKSPRTVRGPRGALMSISDRVRSSAPQPVP
jgi:hypothetical protein